MHIKRKEDTFVGGKGVGLTTTREIESGITKRIFIDAVKDGMEEVGVTERDLHDRKKIEKEHPLW